MDGMALLMFDQPCGSHCEHCMCLGADVSCPCGARYCSEAAQRARGRLVDRGVSESRGGRVPRRAVWGLQRVLGGV